MLCRCQSGTFPRILNKQDPAIKYTVEFEGHKHSPNFLGIINITNNAANKKYEFKVHWKGGNQTRVDPSIT